MAIICLFGLIFGVAALYSQLAKRRLETCLPLAMGSVVVIMYVAGLAGLLSASVEIVLFTGTVAGVAAILLAILKKRFRRLVVSFFTPGMIVYYALCTMVFIANNGKLVKTWDEFTYWADAVKIMTQLNELPTAPVARSLFASYPPALPLWQYLLQGINCLFSGEVQYVEPMLFMSYQWFLLALYVPFLQNLKWNKPIEVAASGVLIPLVALSVFPEAFNQLHSDTLLGTLGGFVCALAFFSRKNDWFDLVAQMVMLFVLVLVKDAGILFAVAGVCVVAVSGSWDAEKKRRQISNVAMCIAAVVVARMSWSIHVTCTGATAQATFDDPIRLSVLLDPAQHWRITTLRNFVYQFFEHIFPAQGTTVYISYFMAFVILGVGYHTIYAHVTEKKEAEKFKHLCIVIFGASMLYIIGTGLTYVFKFYEDEAVRMASYTRYMNIIVMFCAYVLFVCFVQMRLTGWFGGMNKRLMVSVVAVFMLFAPSTRLLNAVSRLDAQAAYQSQEPFLALEQKVFDVADKTDRIYLIAAGSGGFEQVVMRYRLRPLYVGDEPWNIGVEIEEDRFTAQRTPQELQNCLLENYDLLVICALTPEFSQTYAELFEKPENLAVGQIYRINRESGLLELVAYT